MAKRRAAEPLTFHVPWKRLLLCDFTDEPPPLWVPPHGASHLGQPLGVPELPRKRKIGAGAMTEPSVLPSKRRDGGDGSAAGNPGNEEGEGRSTAPGEPPERLRCPREEPHGGRPQRGGGDEGAGRAAAPRPNWGAEPRQLVEEFWQYNTFQYWRNPLPPINLADIEDINEEKFSEAALQGKNEVAEIDMES
ncbi:PREDICTED: uncharacterized protein C9orf40 homolog [Elephantulus edwardii]|uniref:uncharacterized protein C9orf40 homolog n=1 Tax=Elephantulus edwardii TaxID=28737 RepID=UPI0003F0883F|nr:PREDICTED: uncharacterized protein C9orf40 homolog [Elephantulus edwardii]